MTEEKLLDIFMNTDALLEGHFLLTSGKHSDRYFQCAKVLQYTNYTTEICALITEYFRNDEIDVVISPAIGGIIVGQEVARQLGKRFIFTERENGKMTLRRGFSIQPNEKLLVCEDVVTTGGSVFEVIDVIKNNGAEAIGVGFIVDRSNGKVDFGTKQFSTIKMDVKSYQPDECPICKTDLPLIKPGSRKFK